MVERASSIPKGFLFGASVAGHQVGDNVNGKSDWNGFEHKNANRLAAEAKRDNDYGNGPLPKDVWKRIAPEAKDPANYISGEASGWWKGYWQEDLDIAADLGLKAVRFSIERSRVQPGPDSDLDPESLKHYKKLIAGCKERGIEPVVTLFHFVNPQWVAEAGGWENTDTPQNFSKYVSSLVKELDGEVKYFLTVNEPEVYVLMGWLFGEWPPQKQFDIGAARRVRKNLIDTHKRSFDEIKSFDDSSQVSAAINLTHVESRTRKLTDRFGKAIAAKLSNRMFLPQMQSHMDFVGFNQYMHNVKEGIDPRKGNYKNEGEPQSDLGWYLNPESLYHTLMETKRYGKPIVITEHGVADALDQHRPAFIRESIAQVLRAIENGVDVRGYLHWSLVDNFEWASGKWPRFGLVGVDYQTQERIVRPSAKEYARIIKDNSA